MGEIYFNFSWTSYWVLFLGLKLLQVFGMLPSLIMTKRWQKIIYVYYLNLNGVISVELAHI